MTRNPVPEKAAGGKGGKSPIRKWMIRIHVWSSAAGFLLLLFFAVTGFLLNHADRFGLDETQTESREIALGKDFPEAPVREEAVAFLRKASVEGAVEDYEIDGRIILVTFRGPGERTDARIDVEAGMAEIETERGSTATFFTEIHRGESTGARGRLLLDVSALLLALISLSGLTSALLLPARRKETLIFLGISAVILLALVLSL